MTNCLLSLQKGAYLLWEEESVDITGTPGDAFPNQWILREKSFESSVDPIGPVNPSAGLTQGPGVGRNN